MYGKQLLSETYQVTSHDGIIKTFETTPGYVGLFKAKITYADKSPILDSEGNEPYSKADFFYDEDETFRTWTIIQKAMDDGLEDFVNTFTGSNPSHNMQCEFGADGGDGIIDFFTPERIPIPPAITFTLDGNNYLMTWYYDYDEDNSESVSMSS